MPLGKLHTWEIVTWKVALGKMPLGKYLTPKNHPKFFQLNLRKLGIS